MVKASDVLADNQDFLVVKEGNQVRKGTVAATIFNAQAIEKIIKEPFSQTKEQSLNELLNDVRSLIPALHAVQLFQFFTPIEWLKYEVHLKEGRIFIAVLYLQAYPEEVNLEIRLLLAGMQDKVSKELKNEISKIFLFPS